MDPGVFSSSDAIRAERAAVEAAGDEVEQDDADADKA
jgi:hypothetical protein